MPKKDIKSPRELFLIMTFVVLAVFYILDSQVVNETPASNPINPYNELTNQPFLEKQLGEYAKHILIKKGNRYYVNRHPSNSPDFFYKIYNFLPPKENDEFRIVFFGNSQLFQVPSGNRIPIPFQTEQFLQKKIKSKKIKVLNLSSFGMNTSEVLITTTKTFSQTQPDLVVLATTPRDFANEENKTMGIAPQYSSPILALTVVKTLFPQHLATLDLTNIDLVVESLAQLTRVWQRDLNSALNQSLDHIWPTHQAKTILFNKIEGVFSRTIQVLPISGKIENSLVKSPSIEKPLYEGETFPNVRSEQFKILLNLLKKNSPSVIIYNEPLRPKTINLYFTTNDYQKKLDFIRINSQENNFQFLDFNGQLADEYFDDWIHLNPQGVDKVAEILANNIYKILTIKDQTYGF